MECCRSQMYKRVYSVSMKLLIQLVAFLAIAPLSSCSDSSELHSDNDNRQYNNSVPWFLSRNSDVVQRDRWFKVMYDEQFGGFYIEDPCDGRTPSIEIKDSILIDDWGLDLPIEYSLERRTDLDDKTEELLLTYTWHDGELRDRVVVTKLDSHEGISCWSHFSRLNGVAQPELVRYFVHSSCISKTTLVVIDCPEKIP